MTSFLDPSCDVICLSPDHISLVGNGSWIKFDHNTGLDEEVYVNFSTLKEYMSNVSDYSLSCTEKKLVIKSGKNKLQLSRIEKPKRFQTNMLLSDKSFSIKGSKLVNILKGMRGYLSSDFRTIYNNLSIVGGENIGIYATDNFRIVGYEIKGELDFNFLIPLLSVHKIVAAIEGTDEVILNKSGPIYIISSGMSCMVSGNDNVPPDYKSFMATYTPGQFIEINKEQLANATKLSQIGVSDAMKGVVELNSCEGGFSFKSIDVAVDNDIFVEGSGEVSQLKLDTKYLNELIRICDKDFVKLEVNSGGKIRYQKGPLDFIFSKRL